MKKHLPNPDLLRKLLRYEPATGKLFWRERSVDLFTDGRQTAQHNCAAWNGKFAGKEALYTDNGDGYVHGRILNRNYFAHRVIWAITYDEWPDHIDHVNGIRSDNRIENLRSVSQAENNRNQKRRSTNTSGVCGVSWCKRDGKWVARITSNGKYKCLGYFDDFDDAVSARKAAEEKYGFHRNHGRD